MKNAYQKNNYWIILLLFFIPWSMTSQVTPEKGNEEQLVKIKEEQQAKSKDVALFSDNVTDEKSYWQGDDLPPGLVLKLNQESIKGVLKSAHQNIRLTLPNPDGGDDLELELTKKQIFSPDFAVFTDIEKGITLDYTPGVHYSGTVKGMEGTQAGISIFEDEIMGIVATQTTNLVLQKLKGSKSDHFFFNAKNADGEKMLLCSTPQSSKPYTADNLYNLERMPLGNCIRIFVEIGNSTVQDRGGMIQAINFITGVFHQSTIIFNDESINTVLSQILVRTPANDPYDGLTDKSTPNIRTTFQNATTTMDADLGQVVVTFGGGTGGIAAGVWNALIRPDIDDRLCVTSKAVGQDFSVYPTYSRMVKVFNHELGHLLNSRHTHACVWNGDNTQIDDYGNLFPDLTQPTDNGGNPNPEGGACLDVNNPKLSVTPTIMSYFDSFAHGQFPMSNGYGTQPGNVIRAAVASALVANEIETSCTAPLNDLCADAWTLECGTTLYGNTDSATENDAPSACFDGNLPNEGVWFTFTGNGQVYTISTADSDFDTQINIFSGTCGGLTCIGANDDESYPTIITSSFTFCTEIGTQYFVYLDGFNSDAGNYTINLSCTDDNVPPAITCPASMVADNDPGDCGAIVTYAAATATDNCGVQSITYSQNSNTFFPVGTTQVTATAMDINGNSANCAFDVTVNDIEPPVASCKNVTVQLDAAGNGSTTAAAVDNGSYDACGISGLAVSPSSFDCGDTGGNTATLTVTDVNGNTASCTATVTVEDNIAPTAACFNPTVEIQPDGMYTLLESDVYDAANSSDNCALATVSFPATTYGCADVGQTFNVTVTVADPSNNTTDCTASVTVALGSALPAGWSTDDIGSNAFGNAYSFDPCTAPNPEDGEFTVTGSGANGANPYADALAFANQNHCGDFTITAKMESVDPNGYGGLMVRETTAAGSKQFSLFTNLSNILLSQVRTVTNGPKQQQNFYRPFPVWLRIQRMGPWLMAYYSSNGTSYQYLNAVYMPLPACLEVGLAAFTNFGSPATAVFSNVSITGGAALSGNGVPDFLQQQTAQAELQAELFPNPTRDIFTLAFPETLNGGATATLRNQIGQVVEQRQLKPGDMTTAWNVSTLPSGLYFMEVRQEGLPPQVLRVVKSQ